MVVLERVVCMHGSTDLQVKSGNDGHCINFLSTMKQEYHNGG